MQLRLSRKGFNSVSAVVLLFLAVLAGSASGASFTASLDRDTISLGETATLSLAFEGAQPNNVPTPNVSGLQISQAGTSQNVSFVNGAMSSSVTVNFSVAPTRTGEFQIPAITVDVNGQQLSSQPLKLTVTQPNAPAAASINSGNEVAFMRLTLPQEKIYAGETIVGELQIFLRDDVQNFGNFQITSTPADGFMLGKTAQAGRSRAQVGNRIYTIIPLSIGLTATRAGDLSVGPFTANLTVVLPSSNQNQDPFFAQFFNQGEQKQVSLATDQIKVQSLPLPNENVPTNFNGAIGNYTMTVNAGPTNVTVGDPITVRVQIAGRGSLDAVKLPDESGWNDFKIFSPTTKTDFSDQLGLQGTKTFEEIVTPENTDIHALPEFSFSFFNPDDGKYHTLTQPPEQLIVRAGGTTPLPTIAATKNPGEEKSAQDILPIKNDLGKLVGRDSVEPLISNPIFLGAQSLPVLAFLAAFIWRKRADNLANNPRLRRKIVVTQLIQIGIGDLKKFAAENNSEQFFATLFRLLQEQLGERLDCPATSITENVVEENPILRGAPENLRNDLRELFQLCNQARYAPVRGTAELNSVAGKFEKIIQELQKVNA